MDERIHFIEHKGKQVLLLDYSHANATEMLLLLVSVQAIVSKQRRESLLVLADFEGAEIDHAVAMKIKEVLTLDQIGRAHV